jgi:hypothetical protein
MVKIGEGFHCVLPEIYRIERDYSDIGNIDLESSLNAQLERPEIRSKFKHGARIAVGIGSRGLSRIDEIAKITINKIKEWSAEPFIVPAMGSHGNAEAAGQVEYLAGYGITEETMGVPICSSLEVVKLGSLDQFGGDIPVYFDRIALEADGIVIINRVKAHTDFRGDIESGLMKMLAIGLGNHEGATTLHMYGSEGLRVLVPAAARMILEKAPVIMGLGIVENCRKEPFLIKALLNEELEEEEKKLLRVAHDNLPVLPVKEIDLLVVDEMGKDISGPGLDTNVIGRFLIRGLDDPPFPKIKRIAVLGLSKKTKGNAAGIGLADFVTRELVDSTDMEITYTNCITSNFVERAFIPMIAENDREAIALSLKSSRGWDTLQARVIRITNTLALQTIEVSSAIWEDLKSVPGYNLLSGPFHWQFDSKGSLKSKGQL